MDLLGFFLLSLPLFSTHVAAQPTQLPDFPPNDVDETIPSTYKPNVALVIGVIALMVSLTFLLFVYAKFCHMTAADFFNQDDLDHPGQGHPRSRFSGIDKSLIDRLPFFQFSSLKGAKEGLECAVCLSRFEGNDILRLLPNCKHAFHIDCIGQWLESHSSCPLCRQKVDAQNIDIFAYSSSLRFLRDPSDLREPDIELFVERELDSDGSSSRFSIEGSFRFTDGDRGKNEEPVLRAPPPEHPHHDPQFLHRFKHKIEISDAVLKNRWSDVNSSDLMAMNSEMLNAAGTSRRLSSLDKRNSDRFLVLEGGSFINDRNKKIREEMERKRQQHLQTSNLPSTSSSNHPVANSRAASTSLIPPGKRSMSEITKVSRFTDFVGGSRTKDASVESGNIGTPKEEKVRKLWLQIARRTVQWFARREQRSESQDEKEIISKV
ncbi:hypothetical protein ACLOJK_040187 [Asimina triloba]